MISQTAEYALRAVVCLARQPGMAQTTQQIAQAVRVPSGYLSKVLQSLGKAGLVRATRGLHGGFVLADDPARISIYQVIQAVDPLQRIRTCPLGIESHGTNLCSLHRRLDDAMAAAEASFRNTFLAELLQEDRRANASCACHGLGKPAPLAPAAKIQLAR